MDWIFDRATWLFDPLHRLVEARRTHATVGTTLITVFLLALGVIECNRQGFLPPSLATALPVNHFYAVQLAFTLVLVVEVISLICTLPCSVAKAAAKQFEILTLILIRSCFKELINMEEPVRLEQHYDVLQNIIASGTAALVVFVLLAVYYRLLLGHRPALKDGRARYRFVAIKKIIALALLAIFFVMGAANIVKLGQGEEMFDFFISFYTVLIFSDILLVLLAQRFLPQFHAIFRNSGFSLATLFIRLALSSEPLPQALLSVGAVGFAVLVALAHNFFHTATSGGN